MKNLNIKLVASDLDGTLLNNDKEISPQTFEAIKKLYERNIMFVPITGRVLSSVPNHVITLPGIEYIITSNGAATNNILTKQEILSCHLPTFVVDYIISHLNDKDVIVEAFSKGLAYCEKQILDNLSNHGIMGQHAFYMRSTRTPVDDIFRFLKINIENIENINFIFKDLSFRKNLFFQLKEKDFASVTSSSPINLEITNKNATKGIALSSLCQTLEISPDEVMCFGDGENDIDMLNKFKFSFAMDNSSDTVKSISKCKTENCHDDGVAKALEKFIFHT